MFELKLRDAPVGTASEIAIHKEGTRARGGITEQDHQPLHRHDRRLAGRSAGQTRVARDKTLQVAPPRYGIVIGMGQNPLQARIGGPCCQRRCARSPQSGSDKGLEIQGVPCSPLRRQCRPLGGES